MGRCWLSMHEALGSIPQAEIKQNEVQSNRKGLVSLVI